MKTYRNLTKLSALQTQHRKEKKREEANLTLPWPVAEEESRPRRTKTTPRESQKTKDKR